MLMKRGRMAALVTAAACMTALCGCGNNVANEVADMNTSNIQRVSNLYAAFQNFRGGRGPKDEAEFKTFIKEFDARKLSMMGVNPDKIDALFTSERDSKPFQVRYNVGGGRGAVDAVVFEQAGSGGKKQVGYTGGAVEDVDDATYQKLLAGDNPSQPGGGAVGAPGNRPVGRPAGAPTGPPGIPTGPPG